MKVTLDIVRLALLAAVEEIPWWRFKARRKARVAAAHRIVNLALDDAVWRSRVPGPWISHAQFEELAKRIAERGAH